MSNLKILIAGAGIAGSASAYWILRAYPNADITIVERDPSLRLTGASVDIRSSAVDIIEWMGAIDEIRAQTTKEEGVQLVNSNGKEIATFRATGRTDIQSVTSEFEIYRGALTKIFLDKLEGRVKIIFDKTVESYVQRDEKIVVTFSKSKIMESFDIFLGADGFGSKTRGMVLNAESSTCIHDEGVHVAYFTIKKDLLKGSLLAKGHGYTRGRVLFLRPDTDPAGRTRANLMNVTLPSQTDLKKRLNKAVREGSESYMTLMEEIFHDADWLAPEVLKLMRESDDFYCSLFGQVRCPILQDGRVVLLGDAGHATPGIGTSLAIIGGYVLAGELLLHPDDPKTALKRYEELMLPFVKAQQGDSSAMQWVNPQTWWGIQIRDWILWFVTKIKLIELGMLVAVKLGFTEKKLQMPDYPWPPQ